MYMTYILVYKKTSWKFIIADQIRTGYLRMKIDLYNNQVTGFTDYPLLFWDWQGYFGAMGCLMEYVGSGGSVTFDTFKPADQ